MAKTDCGSGHADSGEPDGRSLVAGFLYLVSAQDRGKLEP
jgi:hypothetical protein